MRINNNIAALNTYNRLSANQAAGNKSLEKLSSGMRINRAGDDAAGLAISEKMRSQIRGLNQASRNAQDGISLIQTAEGALSETHSILQRMRELGVQAGNDTLQANDRAAIKTEMDQLVEEIDGISSRTEFNGSKLLDGSFGLSLAAGSVIKPGTANVDAVDVAGAKANMTYTLTTNGTDVTLTDTDGNAQKLLGAGGASVTGTLNFDKLGVKISGTGMDLSNGGALAGDTVVTSATASPQNIQIGANAGQTLAISIGDMSKGATGLNIAGAQVDVSTSTAAATTLGNIDKAITKVSTERANLGAYQNRLEHTINSLSASSENLQASESRVRDVDMAAEMMQFTKNNILTQAATAMLAQANQQPQGVLQLLR